MLYAHVAAAAAADGCEPERPVSSQKPPFPQVLAESGLYHGGKRWRVFLRLAVTVYRLRQIVRQGHGCSFHVFSVSPTGETGEGRRTPRAGWTLFGTTQAG